MRPPHEEQETAGPPIPRGTLRVVVDPGRKETVQIECSACGAPVRFVGTDRGFLVRVCPHILSDDGSQFVMTDVGFVELVDRSIREMKAMRQQASRFRRKPFWKFW